MNDSDILPIRKKIDDLIRLQRVFSQSFLQMPVKERARMITLIQSTQKELTSSIDKMRADAQLTSGQRFMVDNIRNSLALVLSQWHKVEKQMEQSQASVITDSNFMNHTLSGQSITDTTTDLGAANQAEDQYLKLLEKQGKKPSAEVLQEFHTRVGALIDQAKEKFSNSSFSVDVVEVDGKIKVRIKPGSSSS